MTAAWALVCVLLTCAAEGHAHEAAPLKVVTFNVWGVPHIAPSRGPRFRKLAPEIAGLGADIVLMQEVWTDEDAATLARTFTSGALPYVAYFGREAVPPSGSGLLIASRFPLQTKSFHAFAAGQFPHIPWHVDWMAKKGLGVATVATPQGPLVVATTHLQANYRMGSYAAVQIAQAKSIVDWLAEYRDVPTILGGDLNAKPTSVPFRLIKERGEFDAAPTGSWYRGIDVMFHRGALARVSVKKCLEGRFQLDDGSSQPLSDHPCVIGTYRVASPRARAAGPAATVAGLAEELAVESRVTRRAHIWSPIAALVLTLVGLLFIYRRPHPTRGAGSVVLSAAIAVTALWLMYVGLVWAVEHRRLLDALDQAGLT